VFEEEPVSEPGFRLKIRPLELLSEEQVADIHRSTLQVLWNTGVCFESEWALRFLGRHGCAVDRESQRVRFPAALVEECLSQAPGTFRVKARAPEHDLTFGGDTLHFSHGSGMHTIDLDTFEPRPPTRAEYADCVRVLDALPTCKLPRVLSLLWFRRRSPCDGHSRRRGHEDALLEQAPDDLLLPRL
jgi:trimethylamine:corrinoid methyltransferase-like protein